MPFIKLPGLIDPHVHLRTPGQEHKEDFYTGTSAALAGGFTTIIDMPNNKIPITTRERLEEKIKIAKEQIVCDVGFYFGSLGDNLDEFRKLTTNPPHLSPLLKGEEIPKKSKKSSLSLRERVGVRGTGASLVHGLKLYLNETTGNFLISKEKLEEIYQVWPSKCGPILNHAEEDAVEAVIETVRKTGKRAHFCHISLASDLQQIMKAKEENLPITCGVTPHHLFLTEDDAKVLGPYGKMKPYLKSKKDVAFLWKHLKSIDVVESDHAPHTKEEKEGEPVPFGVPGLETTLPLLLTAVSENRLTIDEIIRLCHTNPAKIFNIPIDKNTYIEVNTHNSYLITNNSLFTKCKWTPFEGMKVKGKVIATYIRGRKAYEKGKLLAKVGSGRIL